MFRTLLVTIVGATLTVVAVPGLPTARAGLFSVSDTAGVDACAAASYGDGATGDCVFSATPGYYFLQIWLGGSSATGRVTCEPFGPYGDEVSVAGPSEESFHHLRGGLCVLQAIAPPGQVAYVGVSQ